jgi:tetratricopeptide (TPR) repeat protein
MMSVMLKLWLAIFVVGTVVSRPAPVLAAAPPVDARVEKAKRAYESGQFDEAAALCRQVLTASPEDAYANAELMRALYAKGEAEEVIKIGEPLVARSADVPAEAYLALGGAYESLREPEKAAAAFRDGMARYPSYAKLPFNLGVNRMQLPRLDEARPAFARSLTLDPSNTNAWLYLGKASQELRIPGDALVAYGRFLVLEPTSPRSSRPAQAMNTLLLDIVGARRDKKTAAKSDAAYFPEALDHAFRKLAAVRRADKEEDAFWRGCALAYFDEARRAQHLEAAAYEMRRSLGEPEVASWLASHGAALEAFGKWSQEWTRQGCRSHTK